MSQIWIAVHCSIQYCTSLVDNLANSLVYTSKRENGTSNNVSTSKASLEVTLTILYDGRLISNLQISDSLIERSEVNDLFRRYRLYQNYVQLRVYRLYPIQNCHITFLAFCITAVYKLLYHKNSLDWN